jgi:predicted dienelactone hydrolase
MALLLVAVPAQAASPTSTERFVATQLPDSPVGRQMGWFIGASRRLPIATAELRSHFTKRFLASPGSTPAEINDLLPAFLDPAGTRLVGLTLVQPGSLVAVLTGRDRREILVTFVVGPAGLVESANIDVVAGGPDVALPRPSGPATVGSDIVQLVDHARGDRRLMLTRWYPAAPHARRTPLASYASPRLTAVLGLPAVHVHAHRGARARPGRLPVVLFSPGLGEPRVHYQAIAEDLASHGYLVIGVDHTGEAPVEFPDGRIELQSDHPLAELAATRLADMRLVLRRLNTMAAGPRGDRRRVAAIGHSFGGSTAAALMRADPTVRAGVDLDGAIFGPARWRGVPRPFLVMSASGRLLSFPAMHRFLAHPGGPRLALTFAGFEHMSFSDWPVTQPANIGARRTPTARDVAVQRVYLRAFLDRYVLGRRSHLLDGASRRWPQVGFPCRRAHAGPASDRCIIRTGR